MSEIGDVVLCDWCKGNFTTRGDVGGIIWRGKAICPSCVEQCEVHIPPFGRASRPSEQEPFADFVRRMRSQDAEIVR